MSEIICLDPSCFISLERLRDTKNFLDEFSGSNELKIYIPTEINRTVNLQPNMKFQKLPTLIEDWLEDEQYDIRKINQVEKNEYVNIMRQILYQYYPKPVDELIGNLKKTGTNSLYLDQLIERFGKSRGKIMFEIAAISNEYKAKIIAFGEKTVSLFINFGTKSFRGISEIKKKIKDKARIKTPLNIMMYYFVPAESIYKFIHDFQIQGIEGLLNPTLLIPLGYFLIANG